MSGWLQGTLWVLALGAVACAGPAELSNDDVQLIREAHAALDRAAMSGDWDSAVAIFTDDATIMAAGQHPVIGREAIRASMSGPGVQGSVELLEIAGAGNVAYVRGQYTITSVGSDPVEPARHGSMLEVWRKQPDGSWRLAHDTSTTWPSPSP